MDFHWLNEYRKQFPEVFEFIEGILENFPEAEKLLTSAGVIKSGINEEAEELFQKMARELKPYKGKFVSYDELPTEGRHREDILQELQKIKEAEDHRWQQGLASGAVYHGDKEHIDFLNKAYALHSQSNPLHFDLWPSASKFESEIIAMTAAMLSPGCTDEERKNLSGTITSGGTESILLAMKTYRDYAEAKRGIRHGEIIAPITAHAAFDKAAQYFKVKLKKIPVDKNYQADISALKKAITHNTIAIVGSAPQFPHGVIDPIAEMSEIAQKHNIPFHTDACLGGFVLPFARKLGVKVPDFGFELPGVTSISVDTHKYGYAAKGTSVLLYRNRELRHYQFFSITNWPGGMYFSPTLAGSRPGGLSAACWAALVSMGEKGYLQATEKILTTANTIKQGIRTIPGLKILGEPLYVLAFTSDEFDIYRVMEYLTPKGYSLNGLHRPAAVHIAITLRHTQPGFSQRFLADLREAVDYVRANPQDKGSMAPMYGLAANIPLRSVVDTLLKRVLDAYYQREKDVT